MTRNMITSESLPVKRSLFADYWLSVFIAILVAVSSAAGLLYPKSIYPTEELYQSFLPNDIINLLIGLPVLLVSIWLTRRGKLVGLLFWPGALFYMVYNYLVYLVSMPVNVFYFVFPVLVIGSLVLSIRLLMSLDGAEISQKLTGKVPEKFGGGVMVLFGVGFIARVVMMVINSVTNQVAMPITEVGLHLADVVFSVAFLVGGIQLWRRRIFGYLAGLGLLFQASMLFVGLIGVLLIQPLLIGGDVSWGDIAAVFLMGFVTFIPFGLFVGGVNRVSLNVKN